MLVIDLGLASGHPHDIAFVVFFSHKEQQSRTIDANTSAC